MKTLTVTIPGQTKTYPIITGSEIIDQLSSLIHFENYSKVAILTDDLIKTLFLDKVKAQIPIPTTEIIIPRGEENKNIDTVLTIWKKMLKEHFDRKSLFINLGGGVVGDIGGYAASSYMRGIDFIQIPTTIVAQVDASIGGKTGINLDGYKNIIGSIEHPSAVIIDLNTLDTLPDREYISGFAEVVKHGLIADEDYFQLVISKKPRAFTNNELTNLIQISSEIKSEVVEQDAREDFFRKLLNFGHTIGHAIESCMLSQHKKLLHGEAVSIGIVAESYISHLLGNISKQDMQVIENGLKYIGLPTSIESINRADVLEKIKSDKKNKFGKVKWTLLKEIGLGTVDAEVEEKIVKKGIDYILK